MTPQLADLQAQWTTIAPILSLRNEEEYDAAINRLNMLVDEVGTNQQHPLYGLVDTLGTLVHTYEEQHHVIPDVTGPEVLKYLMDEHGLAAVDLADFGPPDMVELYLAGNHDASGSQIRTLATRFHVSPAAFI